MIGPILIALVVIVLLVLVSCLKVVPQAQAYVVERLGAYQGTWSVGFHVKVPFLDKIARKVNLKERLFITRSPTPSCLPTVWKIP